jgi:integrase
VRVSTHHKGKERKQAVWELRYRLPSGKDSVKVLGKAWGKKSRPAAGYLTQTQAHAKAQEFLDDHAESVPEDRMTLGRAVDRLIAQREEKGLVGGTLRSYRNIGKLLGERGPKQRPWSGRALDSFTVEEISAVRSELVKAGRAPGTINQWRVVVRGLWGTRKGSPALGWDWKALSTDPKDDLDFYRPDEAARLIAAADDDTDAAIFTLAVQAGPRKSEIRALRVKDCDFAGGLLRFARGYTNEEGFAANKGKELRSVPMSPEVAARLRPLCEGKAPDDLVFEPERGAAAICGSALYRRFVHAAERAKLRRIRFHDLRHSFGTQAIQKFDIYTVQRWLGHKSISTTEKYLHYRADASAAEAMGALWATSPAADVVLIRRVA